MRWARLIATIAALALLLTPASATSVREPRPMMGFTTWPWAATKQAVDETADFIRRNGDSVAEQFDNGVPWYALLRGEPWPEKFEAEIKARVSHKHDFDTVILSLNPLSIARDGMAPDVGPGTIVDLRGRYIFQDSRLANAYGEYAGRMLLRFRATYLVYGIEVNEFLIKHPEQWDDFVRFMKQARKSILKYDDLYLGVSISLHNLVQLPPKERAEAIRKLRELTDDDKFIAISYYPFLAGHRSRQQIKEDFAIADQLKSKKNIIQFMIVSETGEIAEPLVIPSLKVNMAGSEKIQADYLQALMEETTNRNCYSITWFTHRDYDALMGTFPPALRDLGRTWRDTGLIEERGRERAAFGLWQQWLKVNEGRGYPGGFAPTGRR